MRTRSRLRYWIASARWPVEIKVFEQGGVFFRDLVQIRTKYGLEKWAFELKRHGAAKDLKTTYSILPEHQLAPEQQREFQALRLHDLEKVYSGNGGEGDGATVDAGIVQSIAFALKKLPKEATDRFCQHFGVARIKDLPARQVEKALPYLDLLDAECKAIAQSEAAVDPFG